MRGKVGLVIGLAAGYVLGTRAGRERYEQIKTQADKLWSAAPVQSQVDKVKDFAKSSAAALPSTVWDTAVKVTKAATTKAPTSEAPTTKNKMLIKIQRLGQFIRIYVDIAICDSGFDDFTYIK